jgi:antitoxin (DNA-binding transcriptional repressor) of toxin-antitoxin stability system
MRRVGLKVLKNKLSEYVRLAAGGETVLVTDRDRVVAALTSPHLEPGALSDREWLAEASRRGWITPATSRTGRPPPRGAPVASLEEILRELAADREDR